MGKRIVKYLFIIVGSLIGIGCIGFYIWSQQTYQARGELYQRVTEIRKEGRWIIFEPETSVDTGVILYPGAKVDPEAYSYIAMKVSEQGYVVSIPEMRFNLPIFDINKANDFIKDYPSIEDWYIGGHSLGGVAAASYAIENLDLIEGVFFLASYPSSGNDFSSLELPMLSIYAEKDGLSTPEKVLESRELLSKQVVFYQIDGGNHAQFGLYGSQKGDNEASITAEEQQMKVINQLVNWLRGIKSN